jgi:beta-hydroxylase
VHAVKWVIVGVYAASILYVYLRGSVRLRFFRQLFDHSSLVAPINSLMYLFSAVPPSRPYVPVGRFPGLATLGANWQTISEEALHLREMERLRASEKNDDAGFNSFFKAGWKRFYLKWYEAAHPSAEQLCPKTVALLKNIPEVKAALFAELPPGAKLNPHRDPFAGSLRYHLGLVTPNDDRCFIEVDGQRYSWRDGEGVIFDETFIHWAHNQTDCNRIILFCDVERPMRYRWAQAVNRWLGRRVMTAASSPNDAGDQTGVINRLFYWVWLGGRYRRRLKNWNRTMYYCVKGSLIAGVVLLIVFA